MQTFDHKHGRIYIHCVFVELILNWLSIHCKHTSKQALGAQLVTIIRKWTNFHRQNCSVHSFGCATLFMALSIPYCFKLPLYFFPWKLADHRLTTEHHIHIYKFVVVSILGESLSLAIKHASTILNYLQWPEHCAFLILLLVNVRRLFVRSRVSFLFTWLFTYATRMR